MVNFSADHVVNRDHIRQWWLMVRFMFAWSIN